MSGASQNSNFNALSNTPTTRTRPRRQEHTDTQRSLQEASAALETAYNRIRQVRRGLIELSDSLPPVADRQPRLNQDGIRPTHDALLLSGGMEAHEEAYIESLMAAAGGSMPSSIPHPNGRARQTAMRAAQNTSSLESSPLFQSPPLPSVVPPRFSRQGGHGPPQPISRSGIINSAATTRGLRVAAREADPTLPLDGFQEIGIDFAALTEQYERIIAHQRRLLNWEGTTDSPTILDNGSRIPRPASRAPEPREVRRTTATTPTPSSATTANGGRIDPRRWRVFRANGRSIATDAYMSPSERLPLLSEGDAGEIQPQPTTTNIRPEPLADATEAAVPRLPPDSRRLIPVTFGQNERAIGNPDWTDEEFISWLFPEQDYGPSLMPSRDPQNPDTIRITRTTDTSVSPSEDQNTRRGWARLDPDGNEIPPDEEEELERSRTEYRLRALQRTRQVPNTLGSQGARMNGRNIYGGVMDSTSSVPAASREERPSAPPVYTEECRPFYVDPLPMSLASMALAPHDQDDLSYPDVIIPKYACLAGR